MKLEPVTAKVRSRVENTLFEFHGKKSARIAVQKATWTQYGKNMGKITVIKKLRKWSPPEIEDVQEPFGAISLQRNSIQTRFVGYWT